MTNKAPGAVERKLLYCPHCDKIVPEIGPVEKDCKPETIGFIVYLEPGRGMAEGNNQTNVNLEPKQ